MLATPLIVPTMACPSASLSLSISLKGWSTKAKPSLILRLKSFRYTIVPILKQMTIRSLSESDISNGAPLSATGPRLGQRRTMYGGKVVLRSDLTYRWIRPSRSPKAWRVLRNLLNSLR